MSDPLSYLPLAIAGANGVLDDVEARRLVAAGVALLQRTAPVVRALHGRRSAILLDGGAQLVVALAASEGRSALLLDPSGPADERNQALTSSTVGVAFTVRALEPLLPRSLPRVLLDEAPARAVWQHGDEARTVDLTMHAGLHLEGEDDAAGADEDVLVAAAGDPATAALGNPLTHRRVLACGRATARSARLAARDHTLTMAPTTRLFGLVVGVVAPLLAGGRVTSAQAMAPGEVVQRLEGEGVSMLVAAPRDFAAILDELRRRGRALDAPLLQHCVAGGFSLDGALPARWYHEVGVHLIRGDDLAADLGFSVGGGAARG